MNTHIRVDKKDLPKYVRDNQGREFKLCLCIDNRTGRAFYKYVQYKFTLAEKASIVFFGHP